MIHPLLCCLSSTYTIHVCQLFSLKKSDLDVEHVGLASRIKLSHYRFVFTGFLTLIFVWKWLCKSMKPRGYMGVFRHDKFILQVEFSLKKVFSISYPTKLVFFDGINAKPPPKNTIFVLHEGIFLTKN